MKIGWCNKMLYQYQEIFNLYYLARIGENTLYLIFSMDIKKYSLHLMSNMDITRMQEKVIVWFPLSYKNCLSFH